MRNIILGEPVLNLIIGRLCEHNFECYIVGGAIRDMLNDVPIHDYDIATNADQDQIKAFFHDLKIATGGTFFKVVIVEGIEIATYRTDTYLGLSSKKVIVGKANSIEEDLARRDLTINSMAYCPLRGHIIDIYGGVKDLNAGIIRFTGDPEARIYEDPCRILRACRFKCAIDGEFEEKTFEALKKFAHLVKEYVDPDRIRLEIMKSMKYAKPSIFFQALHDIGVLNDILPTLEACYGHSGGPYHCETIFEHLMLVGDSLNTKNRLLRLVGYLHDIGKPASAFVEDGMLKFTGHEKTGAELVVSELKKLKFSNADISFVQKLVRHHMKVMNVEMTGKTVRKFLRKLHESNVKYEDWLQLRIADRKGNLARADYTGEELNAINALVEKELIVPESAFGIKDLAINGKDVMQTLNIKPGAEVGKTLGSLLDLVIDQPQLNTRETLLSHLKEV